MAESGIYAITNTKTGEQYVGYTTDIPARIRQHSTTLRRGKHQSQLLQAAWDKHGESAFEVTVLEHTKRDRGILERAEAQWIARLNPAYNRLHPIPWYGDAALSL